MDDATGEFRMNRKEKEERKKEEGKKEGKA